MCVCEEGGCVKGVEVGGMWMLGVDVEVCAILNIENNRY